MEDALRGLGVPLTILRAGWFLDNSVWDVESARAEGILHSFLQPLDRKYPMVAAKDVGRVAAELIQQAETATRVVELEGPSRVSPNELAAAFAHALGTPVRAEAVPRASWEPLFRSQGMKHPEPRIRMLDGFNEGWIEFHDGGARARKGTIDVGTAIAALVAAAPSA
jgi:uncharacterized protein YbjT (DUF2867 family)